jgi:hypothetical protein
MNDTNLALASQQIIIWNNNRNNCCLHVITLSLPAYVRTVVQLIRSLTACMGILSARAIDYRFRFCLCRNFRHRNSFYSIFTYFLARVGRNLQLRPPIRTNGIQLTSHAVSHKLLVDMANYSYVPLATRPELTKYYRWIVYGLRIWDQFHEGEVERTSRWVRSTVRYGTVILLQGL